MSKPLQQKLPIMTRSLACLLLLMLAACGQSGALYLPDREPAPAPSSTKLAPAPTAAVKVEPETAPEPDEQNPKKDPATPQQP